LLGFGPDVLCPLTDLLLVVLERASLDFVRDVCCFVQGLTSLEANLLLLLHGWMLLLSGCAVRAR
jgi:hypothetical protein